MGFWDGNIQIDDLPFNVYRDLVNELDNDSAWKILRVRIAEELQLSRKQWFNDLDQKIKTLRPGDTPAELFLRKLKSHCCNVQILCDMLRNCDLLDALYIIVGEEELEITKQPNTSGKPYEAAIGDTITITCSATGLPPPRYQWLHGNVELYEQKSSTLSMEIKSLDQEGEYQCKISQYNREGYCLYEEHSKCVSLTIKPMPVRITKEPIGVKVLLGGKMVLGCEAEGHPSPQYQWYKDNEKLNEETSNTLQIKKFKRDNDGEYYCIISNAISEVHTHKVDVEVDYPREKAVTKVALVIGNSNYQYLDDLRLPTNDAAAVATLLTKMGFHVFCLLNVTLKEMRIAIQIFSAALHPGSYGLFYFVGHGFYLHDFYMMPIDVPEKYLAKDNLSRTELLSFALRKESDLHTQPALFVSILDMCLMAPEKESNLKIYQEIPKMCEFKCNGNLIMAYSTCSFNPSYESRRENNGIYASHLIKYLSSNIPVHKLFEKVSRAVIASAPAGASDQKPMLTTVPAEPYRYLTDSVICNGSGSATSLNSDLTGYTTLKPETINLEFPNNKVSGKITIQPLKGCYLNAIELITSGLEQWDVSFQLVADDPVTLRPMGRNCEIYDIQKITRTKQGSLKVRIENNGVVLTSDCFSYVKQIPQPIQALKYPKNSLLAAGAGLKS